MSIQYFLSILLINSCSVSSGFFVSTKPNLFEIWCDDIMLNQDASVRDYQKQARQFTKVCFTRSNLQELYLCIFYELFLQLHNKILDEKIQLI